MSNISRPRVRVTCTHCQYDRFHFGRLLWEVLSTEDHDPEVKIPYTCVLWLPLWNFVSSLYVRYPDTCQIWGKWLPLSCRVPNCTHHINRPRWTPVSRLFIDYFATITGRPNLIRRGVRSQGLSRDVLPYCSGVSVPWTSDPLSCYISSTRFWNGLWSEENWVNTPAMTILTPTAWTVTHAVIR